MTDGPTSAFDQVEGGPTPSDTADAVSPLSTDTPSHPSVEGMRERFGDAVLSHEVNSGDQHVVYVDPASSLEVLGWLRDEPSQSYDLLADVTAVDYGEGRPIEVVYQLFSIPHSRALRLKCSLPLDALAIRSVVGLWRAADWLEREVYDLFGVRFDGHPDLRRILMPDNYAEGHPLRKDFPLRGRFSRAEQTRRALSSDLHDHYSPAELEEGREPQLVPPADSEVETPESSESGAPLPTRSE